MNLTVDELVAYVRGMAVKTFRAAAERGIRRGAMRALPVLQRAGDNAPPASVGGSVGANHTGTYRRSWRTASIPGGARLFNLARYADVIERGRRRGSAMPPLAAVERWAKLKLHLSKDEARRAAFPIARAIARRGLRGRYVMRRAKPEVTRVVVDEMRREVRRALSRLR